MKIYQNGYDLSADFESIPAQNSGNIEIEFERDKAFDDLYVISPFVGYYNGTQQNVKPLGLTNNKFVLPPEAFIENGYISIAIALFKDHQLVNTNQITFRVNKAVGNYNILPEDEEIWQEAVINVTKQYIEKYVTKPVNDLIEEAKNQQDVAKNQQTKATQLQTAATNALNELTTLENTVNTNETKRVNSEKSRESSENIRLQNESIRQTKESERQTEETKRKSEETKRASAETIRNTKETERQSEENKRKTAENGRNTEETKRETAEAKRQSDTNVALNNLNSLTTTVTNKLNNGDFIPRITADAEVGIAPEVQVSGAKDSPHFKFKIPEFGGIENYDKTVEDRIHQSGFDYFKEVQGVQYSGHTYDKGADLLKIDGVYKQETTIGYQLFNASRLPTVTRVGVTATNNNDGSFTFSGSGNLSEKFGYSYTHTHEETLKLLKVGKITLNQNGDTLPFALVQLVKGNGAATWFQLHRFNPSVDITQEMLNDSGCYLQMYLIGGSGSAIKPGTIKPMLYQDGDGTWESFTNGIASPNPEYPQEPKFVGDYNEDAQKYDIGFMTGGKNLLDFDYLKNNYATRGTKTYTDNSITLTSNGEDCYDESYYRDKDFYIPVFPNKQYTLMFRKKNIVGGVIYVFTYTKNKGNFTKTISKHIATNGNIAYTFTIPQDCYYINFRVGIEKSGNTCTFSDFMILYGTRTWDDVTEFVPFQDIETTTVELNEPLRSLPNGVRDTIENGVVTRRVGKIVLDGSRGWELNGRNGTDNMYTITLLNCIAVSSNADDKIRILCDKFEAIDANSAIKKQTRNTVSIISNKRLYLIVDNTIYPDVATLKTWLQSNPITIYYELTTPTTEQITLPTLPSWYPYTNIWQAQEVKANVLYGIRNHINTFDYYNKNQTYSKIEADNMLFNQGKDYLSKTNLIDNFSGKSYSTGADLLKIDSAYEQFFTQGYQLFDASKLPSKSQGGATVTNNGDGSFTVSGSGNLTEALTMVYQYSHEETLKLLKVGDINLVNGNTTLPFVLVQLIKTGGTSTWFALNNTATKATITQAMLDDERCALQIYIYGISGSDIQTGTIKPMLYQDGDGTWEPFTGGVASPNPEYPQEPKFVGDIGQNLFDAGKLPTKSQGGATVTNNGDGSFTVSGSGELTNDCIVSYTYSHEETLKLIKSGQINFKNEMITKPNFAMQLFYGNNQKVVTLSNTTDSSDNTTITQAMLNDSTSIMRISFSGLTGQTIKAGTVKPMLYQDGDGTYRPYSETPKYYLDFVTSGNNLFNINGNVNVKGYDFTQVNSNTVKDGVLTSNVNTVTDHGVGQRLYGLKGKTISISAKLKSLGNGTIGNMYIYDGGGTYKVVSNTQKLDTIFAINNYTCQTNDIVVAFASGNGTGAQFYDIMVNYGTKFAEFVPFTGFETTTLELNQPLRALPNGVKDTIENGVITRRVGKIVLDENVRWEYFTASGVNQFHITLNDAKREPSAINIVSNKLKSILIKDRSNQYGTIYLGTINLGMNIEGITSINDWKIWLQSNPITVWYELATPVIEPITLSTLPTYYPYTNIDQVNEIKAKIQLGIRNIANYKSNKQFYSKDEVDALVKELKNAIIALGGTINV